MARGVTSEMSEQRCQRNNWISGPQLRRERDGLEICVCESSTQGWP